LGLQVLFLLIFSTLLDYFTGLKIYDAQNKKKQAVLVVLSIIVNLDFLVSLNIIISSSPPFLTGFLFWVLKQITGP
jgi:hypothetical protein